MPISRLFHDEIKGGPSTGTFSSFWATLILFSFLHSGGHMENIYSIPYIDRILGIFLNFGKKNKRSENEQLAFALLFAKNDHVIKKKRKRYQK
jgi:hypothetical protein